MSLAGKLQLKPGQSVWVAGMPQDVALDLGPDAVSADDPAAADAVIAFATNRAGLKRRRAPVVAAAKRDVLAWIAYPKAGNLGSDLNRDSLAALLAGEGIRPVRQVAIDDVWSALRLRPGSL